MSRVSSPDAIDLVRRFDGLQMLIIGDELLDGKVSDPAESGWPLVA